MAYHYYIVNLLTFSSGNVLSWVSPVIPKINGHNPLESNPLDRPITTSEQAWLVATIPFGSIFGCPIAGYLASRYGKKKTLIISSIPMLIFYVASAFGKDILYYLITRTLAGVSCGICFTLLPLYVGETADKDSRGMLGCLFGVFLKLGTISSYLIGPYVSVMAFSLISAIPIIVFIIAFTLWFPETPYHLVSTGKCQKAEKVLKRLRKNKDDEYVKTELAEISEYLNDENEDKSLIQVFSSKTAQRSLMISTGILSFQQLSGIVIILSYLQPILEESNTGIQPGVASSIIGVVQFCINIIASRFVDRFGRRILLIVSCIIQTVSLVLLGTYFFMKNHDIDMQALYWVPVTSVIMYFLGFSIGLGPVGWAMMGELFDSNVKPVAAPIANFVSKIAAFTITMVFPFVSAAFGMEGSFWLLGLFTFLGLIFIYLFVPETKCRTFKEIQNIIARSLFHFRSHRIENEIHSDLKV